MLVFACVGKHILRGKSSLININFLSLIEFHTVSGRLCLKTYTELKIEINAYVFIVDVPVYISSFY